MTLLLSSFFVALVAGASLGYDARHYCQPVPAFCKNLTNGESYSLMRLPNAFQNYRLEEIEKDINPWKRLVYSGMCHSGLKLFLCTIHAPICLNDKFTDDRVEIKLCKSFCESVRKSCEPVMNRFNESWPLHSAFNCSGYVDNTMCVREDFVSTPAPPEVICDPELNDDEELKSKARKSCLVIRAEVLSTRAAKGDNSFTLVKIKLKKSGRSGSRRSRKTKKRTESPDRVLLPRSGCRDVQKRVKKGHTYLIILDRKSGRKTKYIVKAIVPWKSRRHREIIKLSNADAKHSKSSGCR